MFNHQIGSSAEEKKNTSSKSVKRRSVLYALGGAGSVGLLSRKVVANTHPTADFAIPSSTPDPDEEITLDGTESTDPDGDITDWTWEIETADGDIYTTDYSAQPTFAWDTAGDFEVTLTVTNSEGLNDTITKVVEVENITPRPDFSFSTYTPNPEEEVILDGTDSTDPDGEIVDYEWEIETEDGDIYTTDYTAQPSYTWDEEGTYEITLTVTDNGERSNTETKTIEVANTEPVSSFSFSPSSPNPGDKVSFDMSATEDPDGEIVDYQWEIEKSNNSTYSPSESQPTYTWHEEGTYDVTLTVADNNGATASARKRVVVNNKPPEVEFSWTPDSPKFGEEVTFSGLESNDPDGRIEDYEWEIETSTGEIINSPYGRPTYAWTEGGSYEVTLTAVDNEGKSASLTKTVEVGNSKPTAAFSYAPESPTRGEEIVLDGTQSQDSDGEISIWEWEIENPDGSIATQNGAQVNYTLEQGGIYNITLFVTDNGQATDSTTQSIELSNQLPEAEFSRSHSNPASGTTVTFDGSSSTDPDGDITSYAWEVTYNGEVVRTARGETIDATFDEPGDYTVILKIADGAGAEASTQEVIEVTNQPPNAEISNLPEEPTTQDTVTFDSSDSIDPDGQIVSYQWKLQSTNGEVTRAGPTVEYNFDAPGSYDVQLTVEDNAGSVASDLSEVRVLSPADSNTPSSDSSSTDSSSSDSTSTDSSSSNSSSSDSSSTDSSSSSRPDLDTLISDDNGPIYAALAGLGSSAALIGSYKTLESRSDND